MSYLTYEEFQNLGGKCTEDAFPSIQYDVESKMDYITSGRLSKMISQLENTPKEVQMLEVKLIDIQSSTNSSNSNAGLTSYSNGIESFGYDTSTDLEELLIKKFTEIMKQYLYPKYPDLFYRGRRIKNAWNNNITE